jgi:N-acetylmuramoyl-L-alanine amidase-like protein
MSKLVPIHKPSLDYQAESGDFGHGAMTPARVVLHDTECHDAAGISEIKGVVGFWMQTSQPNRLGAHFIVDADGNVGQCGEPTQLLYHVGGLNTGSIGIEQIGFAAFTEKDWLARPHQLDKVARLLAWIHREYQIPLEVPAKQGASQANRGVMTHAMVSRFESASEGHTDPGSGYPLAHVLGIAKAYVAAGGWLPPGETHTPARPAAPSHIEVTWVKKGGGRESRKLSLGTNPYRWLWMHHPRSWRRGHPTIRLIHPPGGNA